MTAETHEVRLKRLRMRSARRGTKEMDLILMRFADAELDALDAQTLDRYESLLDEPDQDLYAWISGQIPPPPDHADLVAQISAAIAQET